MTRQEEPRSFWIDATALTFADSSGLNVIMSLAKPYRLLTGRKMAIKASTSLARLLDQLKVDYFDMEVHEDPNR